MKSPRNQKVQSISLLFGACALLFTTASAKAPCDIFAAGNTPCAAAFSTVRALYDAYDGNLYQVRRKSDNATMNIVPLSKGGIANSSIQDNFCSGTSCTISVIYDQSSNHNDLTKAPGGSVDFGPYDDVEADANALPVYINGYKAYGVHIVGDFFGQNGTQVGYRNTTTIGVAKGDNPETIYMVADGQYVNGACCFNFGNALMEPKAGGYGTMESVYLGTNNWWTTGSGDGPWVMADLEVGVYAMGGAGNYSDAYKSGNKVNSQSQSLTYPFVTAYLKGNSSSPVTTGGPFVLKGGNAQSGALTSMWNGDYPIGYFPMNRGGGIVLGIGGDNSSGAQGNFYEGVMTTGFATEAMDAEIQANIVAARYGQSSTILSSSSASSSSSSVPAEPFVSMVVPGTIQMENYNKGGEGVAYHDDDGTNSGGYYRADGVDVDSIASDGYTLGWLVAGEWTEYTIKSTVTGNLDFAARVSCAMAGGAFHLELDGSAVTPVVSVGSTGGWDVYQIASGTLSNVSQGIHTLRFVIDTSYFNIDWIQFSENATSLVGKGIHNSLHPVSVSVFDIYGKRVGSLEGHNSHDIRAAMNHSNYKPGVYIIRHESSYGVMSENVIVSLPK